MEEILKLKELVYVAMVTFATAILESVTNIIVTALLLVLLDFFLAIMTNFKKRGFKSLQSRIAFAGLVSKVFIYFSLFILAGALANIFKTDFIPEWILFIIALVEVKSIDEHFNDLFGYSLLNKMMDLFLSGKTNYIRNLIKDENDRKKSNTDKD